MLRANFLSSERKSKSRFPDTDAVMYLTAFLFPVLIVTLIYIASGVWPFGDQCFLKTDMYHQYAPFFSEFREKLVHEESLFYSFDVGLGVNFLAVYAYYLASPLNFLVVLAPKAHVIEFMNLLMILKLGLCSLSFTYYLRQHIGRRDAGLSFFGILYSLSGYLCAYYWNLMWLDCIALFPLIILSLEKLVKDGKVFPYALFLGLSIWSNYYISIMICIFLVLWFFALCVLYEPKGFREFMKRGILFTLGSLAAGAFAAVLLLPAINALKLSASATSTFPKKIKEYFSILDMLERMLPAVTTEQALEHWPNIYSGTFAFILVPLYLMSEKISVKEKAVYLTACLFFLASFAFNFLDYIWHGLHFPNSLPCRQSFIFVFLVLFMCARAYMMKRSFTRKELGTALAGAVIFILYAQRGADEKYFSMATFYMALALCALYAAGLGLYANRRLTKSAAFMFAMILVTWDVTVNASVTSFTTCSRTYYVKDNEDIRGLLAEIAETDGDTDLYRFEKVDRRTKDDGAWLNFPSVSLFSSTADAGCTKFFTKLGCEASTNAYSITGSTPLVDAIFNIKYGFYPSELEFAYEKELIKETDTTFLYQNLYHTSLGFILPENLQKEWVFDFDNPVMVQNSLCDALSVPHVLKEITQTAREADGSVSVCVPENGEYYAYVSNTAVKSVTATWNMGKETFDNLDRKYLISLSEIEADDKVKFVPKDTDEDMKLKLYRFDYDALRAFVEKLTEEPFTVTEKSARKIRGTVTSEKDGAELFFSIPFDEGWRCEIDGEPAETHEGFDGTFLCVPVPSGTHEVSLTYVPAGFRTGLLLTLSGLLLMAVLFLYDRKLWFFAEKKTEEEGGVPVSGENEGEKESPSL